MDRNFGPSKITVADRNFGPSKITVADRNFGPSKTTVVDRNFGPSKITDVERNFGLSKITVVDRNFGPSIITIVDRNFGSSKITVLDRNFGPSKFTVVDQNFTPLFFIIIFIQIYVPQVVHWTIVQMDGPKLRISGGPLDHCPFGRLSFVNLDGPNYAIWTKEPSSPVDMNFEKNIFLVNCLFDCSQRSVRLCGEAPRPQGPQL